MIISYLLVFIFYKVSLYMEKGDTGKITICGCWTEKVLNSLVDM